MSLLATPGQYFVIVLGLCLDTIWKRIRAEAPNRRPKNPWEGVPHWGYFSGPQLGGCMGGESGGLLNGKIGCPNTPSYTPHGQNKNIITVLVQDTTWTDGSSGMNVSLTRCVPHSGVGGYTWPTPQDF